MKPIKDMTDEEMVQEIMSMSLRARVRAMLYHFSASMEQKEAQRKPPSAMQYRRMEFEMAEKIIDEVRTKSAGNAPTAKQIEYAILKLKSAHWHTVERTENVGVVSGLLEEARLLMDGKLPADEKVQRVRLRK